MAIFTLILGGTRSGKSRLAQRLAAGFPSVTYVATARVDRDDAEMMARIERHQVDRPPAWRTIEAPFGLGDAVERAAAEAGAVVIDCLTVWLSNLCWEHRDARPQYVEDLARRELSRVAEAAGKCRVIAVSNELGSGVVPEHAVSRAFRDTQGLVNQWAAEAADEVILTVAGLPLYLKGVSGQRGIA